MISEIRVINNGASLFVRFKDGKENSVPATTLRESAMDAHSRRERLQNGAIKVDESIRITALNQMGSTGLNIQFSDGHSKAIYPLRYIQQILTRSGN